MPTHTITVTAEKLLSNEQWIELHDKPDPRWELVDGKFSIGVFELGAPRLRIVAERLKRALALLDAWGKPYRLEVGPSDAPRRIEKGELLELIEDTLRQHVPRGPWERLMGGLSVEERERFVQKFMDRVATSPLAKHAEYFRSVLRRLVAIEPFEADIALGQSKYGGRPHLPPDAEWPSHADGPLEFVAQINFGEIHVAGTELPETGMLFVFAATRPYDSVFWQDEGYVRAIFVPEGSELVQREIPSLSEAQKGEYDAPLGSKVELALNFTTFLGLPNAWEQREDWPDNSLDWEAQREFHDELMELWEDVVGKLAEPTDHLLGYPAVSSLGYDPTPEGDWIPLLSLKSHDALDWCWHDGGPLHIFIERERLKNRDFSRLRSDAG